MRQYLSKLVFQILNQSEFPQFDEQLRVIEAHSFSEAVEKAIYLGESEDEEFLNTYNNNVRWKFIALTEIYSLENLKHGQEVHSRIIEHDGHESYIKALELKQHELTTNLVSSL